MESLRPNEKRARYAIVLIWIVLTLEIASLISGYFHYDLLRSLAKDGETSIEATFGSDTREVIIGLAYLIVYIISIVTFIKWFRRAYFNLHQKVPYLQYGDGWAAGSWFVPILSLYLPYQIMKELYHETRSLLMRNGIVNGEYLSSDWLGWWWTLWIINNFIGQFVFRYSMKAETIDEMATSTVISMIANVIGIPLAFMSLKIIGDYSKAEPLLHEIKDEQEATGEIINQSIAPI